LESQEDGDLSRWSDEMIAEAADYAGEASQFVQLLRTHRFLDGALIHDWLDYAGLYLISRYSNSKRERLVAIWAKHGRVYNARNKKGNGLEANNLGEQKANNLGEQKANIPTNQPTNQESPLSPLGVVDEGPTFSRAPLESLESWLARQWLLYLRRKPLRGELEDAGRQFAEWIRLGVSATAIEAEIKAESRDRTEALFQFRKRLPGGGIGPGPPTQGAKPQASIEELIVAAKEHNRKQLEAIK
jgi:hypothetical protein